MWMEDFNLYRNIRKSLVFRPPMPTWQCETTHSGCDTKFHANYTYVNVMEWPKWSVGPNFTQKAPNDFGRSLRKYRPPRAVVNARAVQAMYLATPELLHINLNYIQNGCCRFVKYMLNLLTIYFKLLQRYFKILLLHIYLCTQRDIQRQKTCPVGKRKRFISCFLHLFSSCFQVINLTKHGYISVLLIPCKILC